MGKLPVRSQYKKIVRNSDQVPDWKTLLLEKIHRLFRIMNSGNVICSFIGYSPNLPEDRGKSTSADNKEKFPHKFLQLRILWFLFLEALYYGCVVTEYID